jgi:hypothetical protein
LTHPADVSTLVNQSVRSIRKALAMKEQALIKRTVTSAPVLLTPSLVEKMLTRRQTVQVAKFRTTCTDCVPNY